MTVLLGQTGTGVANANSNSGGIAFATRLQCLASGDVSSVWVHCGATVPTAGNTGWAIYNDGAGVPGTRLSASFSGTAGVANTYSSFPCSPTVPLVIGTFYWIAFVGLAVTWNYTDFATTGGNSSDDNTGVITLPATWTQTGGPFANNINMRAEGTSGGPGPVMNARSFDLSRFGPF